MSGDSGDSGSVANIEAVRELVPRKCAEEVQAAARRSTGLENPEPSSPSPPVRVQGVRDPLKCTKLKCYTGTSGVEIGHVSMSHDYAVQALVQQARHWTGRSLTSCMFCNLSTGTKSARRPRTDPSLDSEIRVSTLIRVRQGIICGTGSGQCFWSCFPG